MNTINGIKLKTYLRTYSSPLGRTSILESLPTFGSLVRGVSNWALASGGISAIESSLFSNASFSGDYLILSKENSRVSLYLESVLPYFFENNLFYPDSINCLMKFETDEIYYGAQDSALISNLKLIKKDSVLYVVRNINDYITYQVDQDFNYINYMLGQNTILLYSISPYKTSEILWKRIPRRNVFYQYGIAVQNLEQKELIYSEFIKA